MNNETKLALNALYGTDGKITVRLTPEEWDWVQRFLRANGERMRDLRNHASTEEARDVFQKRVTLTEDILYKIGRFTGIYY